MSQEIIAKNITTGEIHTFDNAMEASRKMGFDSSHIIKCCRGRRTKHKGYFWSYKFPKENFWTFYEDEVLRNNYPSINLEKLMQMLPMRSFKDILTRTNFLNIRRNTPSSKNISGYDLIRELAEDVIFNLN